MGNIIENLKIINGDFCNTNASFNLIRYTLQHSSESPFGGSAVYPLDIDNIEYQFQLIKEKYGKTDGRKVFHFLLTYPDNLPETKIHALNDANEVSHKLGKEFQNVFGLHENTEKVHVHFAVNSVSYKTGKKVTSERIKELITI